MSDTAHSPSLSTDTTEESTVAAEKTEESIVVAETTSTANPLVETTEPSFDYSTLSPEQLTSYTLQYYQYYYPEYYAQLMKSSSSSSSSFPASSSSYSSTYPSSFISTPSKFQAISLTGTTSSMLSSAVLPPPGASVGATKGMRQMNHYFDYEAYVAQRNDEASSSANASHARLTKKDILALKRKKQERKKKKLLEWLHND